MVGGGYHRNRCSFSLPRGWNPELDEKPHWEGYPSRPEPDRDRVLDLLERSRANQDGTLTFRRSCAHGVCGSDAMRINGRNRLACKSCSTSSGTKITIEPMLGLHRHQRPGR